ncbi:hypothetical protein INR49_018361 [Caranx melampygus]|nr:hypothetical protein INR49_018361 [Caranx melampygus]
MFPNAPLGFVVQRGVNVHVTCRRARVCYVMLLNLLLYVLICLFQNHRDDSSNQKVIRIPSKRFWRENSRSTAFWNKEQQRLDFIHNPIINSPLSSKSAVELPGWMNDTGPLDPCEPDIRVFTQIVDYNTLPKHFQDFLLHMRCRSYPMLINQPGVCKENPFLLLVVKSLMPHFDRRQAIRETWGRAGVLANRTVATVFLIGNTVSEDHFPDLLGMLVHEAKLHQDLLQWDYRDTFHNLTLKDVLFLEWFSQNCPHAQYVLKGDDDVFVNTFRIIDFLEGLSETRAKDLFVGDVINDAEPKRDKKLKYFIPKSVFTGQYPPYAGGGGYLYSGAVVLRLHKISQQVVLYPIDDVYTGMCLKKLGLAPEKHSGFKTFDIEDKFRYNSCAYRSLMLVHSRTPQEMLKIWPWIVSPQLDCQ